jgi:hypothetical protein
MYAAHTIHRHRHTQGSTGASHSAPAFLSAASSASQSGRSSVPAFLRSLASTRGTQRWQARTRRQHQQAQGSIVLVLRRCVVSAWCDELPLCPRQRGACSAGTSPPRDNNSSSSGRFVSLAASGDGCSWQERRMALRGVLRRCASCVLRLFSSPFRPVAAFLMFLLLHLLFPFLSCSSFSFRLFPASTGRTSSAWWLEVSHSQGHAPLPTRGSSSRAHTVHLSRLAC